MRISVTTPIKNEFPWVGYSVMAAEPYVHEFIYAVAESSDDGTIELLAHLRNKLGRDRVRLMISKEYDFNPLDQKAYNKSFDDCIQVMSGDAAWFLHPDMIVTGGTALKEGPLAWYTNVTSFAGDFQTKITRGRVDKWKNIHAKKFGLHYFGGYGSQNEDFYHSDITGNAYKHYGTDFSKYPFDVADSGISVNHYCELKSYRRRLEKMKLCIKTQNPHFSPEHIEELAVEHPRVTLEQSSSKFGVFEFKKTNDHVPEVITKYQSEFSKFGKELIHG